MQLLTILSATLGLSKPWRVTDIVFTDNYRRLELSVDMSLDDHPSCRQCGHKDSCSEKESYTWFNDNFLSYETYLHTLIPCCPDGEKFVPPWAQKGSKFVLV